MKYASLIWAGLWRKPLRTTFTMLSLMMAFVLFGLLQSVSAGLNQLIETAHEDRLLTFPRFGNAGMPIAYVNQVQSLPGVVSVAYQSIVVGYVGDPKNFFFVGGTSENYLDANPEVNLTPAQRAALHNTPDGVIISTLFAKRLGLKAGDRVPVVSATPKIDGKNDWSFQVVAVTDRDDNPGAMQFSFGNYKFLNEQRATDKDTIQQIVTTISDPKKAVETSKVIDGMFENSGATTQTVSERLAINAGVSGLGNIGLFVTAIVGCVMFVLLLLTATTMIQSVNERTTEFGVLKTLGFTDRQVLSFIFAESLLQCVLGAASGLGVAWLASPLMQGKIQGPPVVFHIPWFVTAGGLVLAVAVAILSAALPAARIGRLKIADALAAR